MLAISKDKMRTQLITISLLLFASAGICQDSQFQGEMKRPILMSIQGFLTLKTVFPREGVMQKPKASVPVRKLPSSSAPLLMMLISPTEVISTETSYESSQVNVYARNRDWFLVYTKNGKGWINTKNADGFTSINHMILFGFTYLNQYWDRNLYLSSSFNSELVKIEFSSTEGSSNEFTAKCKDVKWFEGMLWLHIIIDAKNPCDGTPIFKTGSEGWVPAYDPLGRLVISWYSRGC